MTLREWLDKTGVTAKEFGVMIGVHESGMCRLLAGTQPPSYMIARRTFEVTDGEVGFLDWPEFPMRSRASSTPKKAKRKARAA